MNQPDYMTEEVASKIDQSFERMRELDDVARNADRERFVTLVESVALMAHVAVDIAKQRLREWAERVYAAAEADETPEQDPTQVN